MERKFNAHSRDLAPFLYFTLQALLWIRINTQLNEKRFADKKDKGESDKKISKKLKKSLIAISKYHFVLCFSFLAVKK